MKRHRLVCAAALAALCSNPCWAQASGPGDRALTDPSDVYSPSRQPMIPVPIDDLYDTRSISDAAWSPDGTQILFSSDLSGRSNLWKVNADGGWPVQLLQSDDRQIGGAWSPDGRWIVFQQDHGGDDRWDLFAVPSDGGEAINLTRTPDVREEAPRWSPDGRSIALNVKPRTGAPYDLAILNWETGKIARLTSERSESYSWASVAWSPDGRTLYANRYDLRFADASVYAVDVASGRAVNLTPHQGDAWNFAASLAPDGKTLLLTSNAKDGYRNVAMLDIVSGKLRWLTDTKWDATAGDLSPDGRSATYTLNADGVTEVFLIDLATLRTESLPLDAGTNMPAGHPVSFSPSGRRLLVSHENSVQPANLWVYDVYGRSAERLSRSELASLATAALPPSRVVHYRSFDGTMISALLWMPYNLRRDGSNPAVVLAHRGPTAQARDDWSPRIAALVSRGYICIAPNVRGSTGYGIAFQRANIQDLGGADLQDEVHAARFLQATGYADPNRIGIAGSSYGGFMSLMAIGKTPDVWAAAVDMFGIVNWQTTIEHEDPQLRQYDKGLLGDPVKDRKVYEASSPLIYLHEARAPLLVLQGANDPNVPREETEQVVDLLRRDGKIVEAHYYADEGHSFEKRENQIDAIKRTLEWFDRYLKGEPR